MNTITARLNDAIKRLNIPADAFAATIGILPFTLEQMRCGTLAVDKDMALRCEVAFGISSQWLLHGTGEMLKQYQIDEITPLSQAQFQQLMLGNLEWQKPPIKP